MGFELKFLGRAMIQNSKKTPLADARFGGESLVSVSPDERSLRKGRRASPRTDVCRPCLFWRESLPESQFHGVLLDLSPYGMRLRALDPMEVGGVLMVQMMRDEEFRYPLSTPIRAEVMHVSQNYEGFSDHGLKRVIQEIKKPEERRPGSALGTRPGPRRPARESGGQAGRLNGPRGMGKNRG